MIPNYENKRTEGGGQVLESLAYTVKSKNIRHIVRLIRDSVYKNKELAPLREYATNAIDAQQTLGLEKTPIVVTLPTILEPELKIRDCGPGLTRAEMEDIYISVGESSKRGTNDQIGSMGLGSKSGYAYGDSFLVTSWKGGWMTVYNHVLDDRIEAGARCDVLVHKRCNDSEHGIEITIPVRQEHVKLFPNLALGLFKYWETFPQVINLDEARRDEVLAEVNKPSVLSGEGWEIKPKANQYDDGVSVAVMGNIPYPIDWDILKGKMTFANDREAVIFSFLEKNHVIFRIPNGDLDFDVSREGLQYTDKTVRALSTWVRKVADSILDIVVKNINKATNIWEAMGIYASIFEGQNWSRRREDGDDLEDTSGFSGELAGLSEYFKDKLIWNGVPINRGHFAEIHRWDCEEGYAKDWRSSVKPVMEVFSLVDGIVKSRKAHSRRANQINPSSKAVVIINDTSKKHGARMACKYYLKHANSGNIKRVYYLFFKDDAIKDEFYKAYNFDTVPVLKVSEWIGKAKEHSRANRVAGDSSSRDSSGPQEITFIKVEEAKRHFGIHWSSETVDIKTEEGYYLRRGSSPIRHQEQVEIPGHGMIDLCYLKSNLHTICEALGLDLERVYGFTDRTLDAKWFQEAKSEGQWKPLSDFFTDEVLPAITEEMEKEFAYIEACNGDHHHFGKYIISGLDGNIIDLESPVNKLIEGVRDMTNKNKDLYSALGQFGIKVSTNSDVDFESLMKAVHKAYPLLWKLNNQSYMKNDEKGSWGFDKSTIRMMAEYINMKDDQNQVVAVNNGELVAA